MLLDTMLLHNRIESIQTTRIGETLNDAWESAGFIPPNIVSKTSDSSLDNYWSGENACAGLIHDQFDNLSADICRCTGTMTKDYEEIYFQNSAKNIPIICMILVTTKLLFWKNNCRNIREAL